MTGCQLINLLKLFGRGICPLSKVEQNLAKLKIVSGGQEDN